MSSSSEPTQEPLLSLRAAVILLLGVQVAVLTAVLILLAGNRWPAAVLGAGAAFTGAVAFARSVIG